MADTPDKSALVIPFGKHRGQTVAEVLATDPQYADWLVAQSWLAQRFAELHAAFATRGSATEDTPEHNALQARFLDHAFRSRLIVALKGQDHLIALIRGHLENTRRWYNERINNTYETARGKEELIEALKEAEREHSRPWKLTSSVDFEHRGIDVRVAWQLVQSDYTPVLNDYSYHNDYRVLVELKPTIGDDFPGVLRQMARNGATVCVFQTCTSTSVPLDQIRQMFAANGCKLISVAEIEATPTLE